jgi:phosphoglycerate dehydrogenase-like enzyme
MGEWITMMLLLGVKRGLGLIKHSFNQTWRMDTGVEELTNKRILFLGTGTIAHEAIKRLSGFDTYVIGMNQRGKPMEGFDEIITQEELESYLNTVDALVVCLPQTPTTTNFINHARLAKLKDDVILINVSRGAVIDEKALESELEKKRFRFVALDVTSEEPLNKDSKLWKFDQVLITPHNSWVSEHRNTRRLKVIMTNLQRYLDKGDLMNTVDIERGY